MLYLYIMVLITGITGLVGSFVAKYLLEKGHPVAGLKRPHSDLSLLEGYTQQITWFEGDILDVLGLAQAVAQATHVVHAAGMVSFAPKDEALLNKINIEGTANVVNACLEASVQKLCFVSSIAALGRKTPTAHLPGQPIIIDEKSTWENDELNSHYAKTKYLAEMEVWRGIAEGLSAVVVNPSIILGEGDWHKTSTQLFKYGYDEPFFYPMGSINYVDVQDLCTCIERLLWLPVQGERFVINGGNISYQKFFGLMAEYFGKKPPQKPLKPWLMQIAWRAEALRSWLTGSTPLLTKETARSATHHFTYRNEKIQKTIGITFTPIEDTLQRICKVLQSKKAK